MTREEATLILGIKSTNQEEIEDRLEELLFEKKQFFLTRTPIRQVFEAHLNKLIKYFEAANFLLNKPNPTIDLVAEVESLNGLDEVLNHQMQLKNKLANQIDLSSLVGLVNQLLLIENQYDDIIYLGVLPIAKSEFWENQIVPIANKADIMEIRNAYLKLREFHNSSSLTAEERDVIMMEFFRIKAKQKRG
jgi:hypothetical protein